MENRSQTQITLYYHPKSGHCHKVALFLSLLNIPYKKVLPDMAAGEHKSEAFLNLNAFGKVPVITDAGTAISDSNAILVYLAHTYASKPNLWLGCSPYETANVQRWLSIAAGELAQGPAMARLQIVFGAKIDVDKALEVSTKLLTTIEQHLSSQDEQYLVGNRVTIADIAMYSYIAHAPEGGVSLAPYPNIGKWLENIRSLDGFIPMLSSETPKIRV